MKKSLSVPRSLTSKTPEASRAVSPIFFDPGLLSGDVRSLGERITLYSRTGVIIKGMTLVGSIKNPNVMKHQKHVDFESLVDK